MYTDIESQIITAIDIPVKPDIEIDLTKGDIYMLYNPKSDKRYIGQALCFVSDRTPWGTFGRWKAHVREAYGRNGGNGKDRCVILNASIRKYEKESFQITILNRCPIKELDYWEQEYIKSFKTISPNGYNLKSGGAKGKDSKETRKRKAFLNKHRVITEQHKRWYSLGQMGNRRKAKKRKYPEDENLPKYIICNRDCGIKIGYSINSFPIGVWEKEYISKSFSNPINPQEAYNRAINYLEELKIKYAHVQEELDKMHKEYMKERLENQREKKRKDYAKNLPEYVYPLMQDGKKVGYYVEGYPDNHGGVHPKKEFISAQVAKRNFNSAVNHIEELKIINADDKFVVPELPMFVRKFTDINRCGKRIKGFNIKYPQGNKKYITKKFCNMALTMEEKYNNAIQFYNGLKEGKIIDIEKKKYHRTH